MSTNKNPASFPAGLLLLLLMQNQQFRFWHTAPPAFLKPRHRSQLCGRLIEGFQNGGDLLRKAMRPEFMLWVESHDAALLLRALVDQLVSLFLQCIEFLSSRADAWHGRRTILANRNRSRHNDAPQLLKNVAEFTLGGGSSSLSQLHYSKSTFRLFHLPSDNQSLSKIGALIIL